MMFRTLDVVALLVDLPEHGLRRGDLGTVVDVPGRDTLEVEFITASGKTQAVVTLTPGDVRPVTDDDVVATRRQTVAS